MTPKRFTSPEVLAAIPIKYICWFFERFKALCIRMKVPLPADYMIGSGEYNQFWAQMFSTPEKLPAPLVEAIVAIEELAAEENRPLLEAKVRENRPANPGLDPAAPPECQALQLWLISPFSFIDGKLSHGLNPTTHEHTSTNNESGHQPSTNNAHHQQSTPIQSTNLAILPSVKIDSDSRLAEYFTPPQIAWILGEDELHAQKKPVFALAEKSVRIGWTFCDGFKNVRKRLRFPKRDYLFVTKDYPSGLEYMLLVYEFARLLNFTRAIVAHGEDYLKVPRLDPEGRPTKFTEEVKVSYIKFDNKSRILAFSAHPQAMAVYGGDVGLDEFAKHPNAPLLWQTAQGRVTWGHDMAVWSAHEGEDTLFNQFAQQARAGQPPWNLYYRVTMANAIDLGLLEVINRTRGTALTRDQFLADCEARAGLPEIFQQTYMCNPVPGAAGIVDWSAIERCRSDYEIERVHLEAQQVLQQFGEFSPSNEHARVKQIQQFLRRNFSALLNPEPSAPKRQHRLGFDVAASGEGDLAVFYIDEPGGSELWLRALLTVRTEDWHFLKTVLFFFLKNLSRVQAAGDETGLGQQICWEAAKTFSSRFVCVNFASKKHDLGFSLMNQLSLAEKRFPKSALDIAADYFALRKSHTGSKWIFSETRNSYNPDSQGRRI